MVTPRSAFRGESFTTPSVIYANPLFISEHLEAIATHADADPLAPLVSALESRRPDWHQEAECRKHPDVDWHSRSPKMRSRAFTICSQCPVMDECTDWSIDLGDFTQNTVLAGMDGPARRRLAQQREHKQMSTTEETD